MCGLDFAVRPIKNPMEIFRCRFTIEAYSVIRPGSIKNPDLVWPLLEFEPIAFTRAEFALGLVNNLCIAHMSFAVSAFFERLIICSTLGTETESSLGISSFSGSISEWVN